MASGDDVIPDEVFMDNLDNKPEKEQFEEESAQVVPEDEAGSGDCKWGLGT